jgi:hypothetical protein
MAYTAAHNLNNVILFLPHTNQFVLNFLHSTIPFRSQLFQMFLKTCFDSHYYRLWQWLILLLSKTYHHVCFQKLEMKEVTRCQLHVYITLVLQESNFNVQSWLNDTNRWKLKCSWRNYASATLSATNPTWTEPIPAWWVLPGDWSVEPCYEFWNKSYEVWRF